MKVRRVLVANTGGVSRVVEDGTPPRSIVFNETPGFEQSVVWRTNPVPSLDFDGTEPTTSVPGVLPAPGGATFIVLTLPPDTVYFDPAFDPAAAGAEIYESSPDMAALFELDNPGMHTTPTVDYDVVLDGELWLELTDGEVKLSAGDVVIQHGTRHAWRNKTDKPATVLAVLIGAQQTNDAGVGA